MTDMIYNTVKLYRHYNIVKMTDKIIEMVSIFLHSRLPSLPCGLGEKVFNFLLSCCTHINPCFLKKLLPFYN